ncbi:MAG TPA: TonB-dependent receptor [Candidatus Polarisedimenticolaceae bacterium]|nr:TonB-dependent receptor [Candidatus Polarisedimenticolaceae bacterium]
MAGEPPPSGEEGLLLEAELPSVYSASRFEQTASEAPASVSVVTAEEIARHGWRSLAEILDSARGFFTTTDRNYTYVTARGFGRPGDYNSRLLLLINGRRVNDNLYDAAYFGHEGLVDVDLIERIEIIRGPSSSIYGASAFFGVINVVTKRGRDLAGTEVDASSASFDTQALRVSWGNHTRAGVELLLSASGYDSSGQDLYYPEFDDPATDFGVARGIDGERNNRLFLQFSRGALSGHVARMDRRKEIPTAAYGTDFNDPRAVTDDALVTAGAAYEWQVGSGQLELAAAYNHYDYTGDYPYGDVYYEDYAKGGWWTLDSRYVRLVAQRHRLLFGSSYQYNQQQSQGGAYCSPCAPTFASNERSSGLGVYAQDDVQLSGTWIASLGVRWDHDSFSGSAVSPRVALIRNAPNGVGWKLVVGRAFRAPSAYEMFYADNVYSKPNLKLDFERITTYETVVEAPLGGRLRALGSASVYDIEGIVRRRTDPADGMLVFDNLEDARGLSLEAELDADLPGHVRSRVSWGLYRAEDRATGEVLPNSPRNVGKLLLEFPVVPKRLQAAVDVRHIAARRSALGVAIDPYTVLDVNLVLEHVIPKTRLSFGVYNAFDDDWADPGRDEHLQSRIPRDGRSFRLGIQHAF